MERYDIIVVGAGHAGCEAAHIAARMGARTLLITMQLDAIARMSCNPAIGGLAKGQLVREIDVLGGLMARLADETGIQFRMLNVSKGPAVRSPRAQIDKLLYSQRMKTVLEKMPNLDIRQGTVQELMQDEIGVSGVILECGTRIPSRCVILTTGTFLDGVIHIGLRSYPAGRVGEPSADKLSKSLASLGVKLGRFMTDTPPLFDKRTIDCSELKAQYGDEPPVPFSFCTKAIHRPQIPCYITYTNPETHRIIRENINQSSVYAGKLEAAPPRYCPDIETKVLRFPERQRHQIFLEPEGLDSNEIYPNGIFTTLSEEAQVLFIRTIKGLERARMTRPAYGIEYTYAPPIQISAIQEMRGVPFLFHAGQINGTSGYEEAAAQGLMAGINAVLKIRGKEPFILRRDEAYIGVLIDDLTTKGTNEPYRMFTSRAEYRLILRHDNADLRLMERARAIGIADDARYDAFCRYRDSIAKEIERLKSVHIKTTLLDPRYLEEQEIGDIDRGLTLAQVLARPNACYKNLVDMGYGAGFEDPRAIEQVEISIKYEGYIERQLNEIARMRRMEEMRLPADLDYHAVRGLTLEAIEKLNERRPATLGQASRISGVSPADISILLIYIKAHKRSSRSNKHL
ncbi:MAG TPA: tRNA uridine-5-carboxymethylaminomethyl(34) synthesis enzyme MnmG [Candidatus Sumerlaeota bacterium]|nr:tRNA uridine-5-carboxymethylaminomethyl(34) synthesis enzyme MnmG [Candidatus Sumerlaeota bacterium]HRR32438.1 tRNA uridine-5-carboxymethylaminomethyl(34) synthesis enzyme MnmG [Candidatus Sumerlaeia bacterium]HON50718.1 tRNA uridine-5-carboxymethylaminomethyl(34) synthesis enzyme MnmG [Candidatus Sumerlaeota bacterium]HOR65164.1 tRNA uridine-5-carboxymethylaminomethyl(34) synthesis enzyme MnmG [Candidatus Sumerlaeota bacterium]HPL75306.1 tRNA uridine-5-carboxymethylaminomethyl(34) synthesis